MLWGQYGTRSFINCAFLGCSNLVDPTSGGTFNFTNCYTDDASPPSGCSTIALDTSTGSGFENITVGTHDLRIKSTSALKNSGTSTGAPSADIMGTSRPQGASYDVGVWEYLDATPASGPHIRKFGPKLENIFHNPR
jgi:hypothetical protein